VRFAGVLLKRISVLMLRGEKRTRGCSTDKV